MYLKMNPEDMQRNVFKTIGKDWVLVCAEHEGNVNAMTASWGGMGVLWNKNVVTIYIRPQRYTKQFIDSSQTFSIMVMPDGFRKQLNYMGTVSGRDEDKIQHCDFHVDHYDETPYFKEAELIIICRKLYHQPLLPQGFMDVELDKRNYPNKDYHEMYVGEIIGIYEKTDEA